MARNKYKYLFDSGALTGSGSNVELDIVRFQEVIFARLNIKLLDNNYWIYNGRHYEIIQVHELNRICQEELGEYRYLFTREKLSGLMHHSVTSAIKDRDKVQQDLLRYLTLQNGLYDVEGNQLIPFTPLIFNTNLLPYRYHEGANCTRFQKYLAEVFYDDSSKITFIQEVMGYIFHRAIPVPGLIMLIGAGSNGKSVFVEILKNLFGEANITATSLNKIHEERNIFRLYGKLLNISSETPRKGIEADTIKAIVAGDRIVGRRIYQDPFEFNPYAKHIVCMNDIPMINDFTHGMWRRLYPVEFNRKFEDHEQDLNLIDKLIAELPGIFNFAIEGYRRLKENEFRFTIPQSLIAFKNQLKEEANNVMLFANEHIVRKEQNKVKFSVVYDCYKSFCGTGNYKPKNKTEFGKLLKAAGYRVERSSKDANQVYVFEADILFPEYFVQ